MPKIFYIIHGFLDSSQYLHHFIVAQGSPATPPVTPTRSNDDALVAAPA
jgi:hypothetical protein